MAMNSEIEELLSYINDNLRFGSKIKQSVIDHWFNRYSLKIEEKFLVYEELDSLKIEVLDHPKERIKAQLIRLYKCIAEETEIKKSVLMEWLSKNKIDEHLHETIFEELNKGNYIIIEDTLSDPYTEEQDFDFIDDDFEDDLDSLLDDDEFIDEVDSLEDVVDKSRNIDYLIQLNNDDAIKSKKALDYLVEANTRLVWKVVKHYSGLSTIGFDLDDMYQVGMEGLMKAAERFDVSLGNTFSTYAIHWIRQAITRGIADYGTLIRIPVHYREKMNKFIRIENELWNKLARPATTHELAEEMEISVDEVEEVRFYIEQSNLESLDRTVSESGDTHLGELLPDEQTPTPEVLAIHSDRRFVLEKELCKRLTDREEEVIHYRFGFTENGEIMTLEEIGSIFNVTRERIRQIESKAIKRLKQHKESEMLKEYLYEY